MGEEYPQDGYQTHQESEQQRINMVDAIVEAMEESTSTVKTLECELQMVPCEEMINLSYLEDNHPNLLQEAVARMNIGGVR